MRPWHRLHDFCQWTYCPQWRAPVWWGVGCRRTALLLASRRAPRGCLCHSLAHADCSRPRPQTQSQQRCQQMALVCSLARETSVSSLHDQQWGLRRRHAEGMACRRAGRPQARQAVLQMRLYGWTQTESRLQINHVKHEMRWCTRATHVIREPNTNTYNPRTCENHLAKAWSSDRRCPETFCEHVNVWPCRFPFVCA